LDAVARSELMEILSAFIADENKGILFSTHITTDLEKIADYITFIHEGRILSTGTKDDLMEKYRVVKGGLGLLSAAQKQSIIGYREHGVGFDGMIDRAKFSTLPNSVVTEQCSLDEIVVRFSKGGVRE
jgi:ABC-2 type transport system ATP-binding protein